MSEAIDNHSICPACGGRLLAGSNGALCPACMLQAALADDPAPESASPRDSLGEQPGAQIGRYKLLERIGEGGFGIVWMAGQEEPVHRRVALKIIKPGMDSREVIARFEAERQALAMMDHPNIASIFDGGTTENGRPFFVMELVEGVPITSYCDANRLTTRERLELFTEVCHAVQHAHQKGIIHRDLKPSNILVTVKDGRPVPKVIDFGIAKATQASLTGRTQLTRLNQWVGTPEYMSPEQAGLDALDVDTRSDIYSLGVLFYELLAGHPPFDPATLRDVGYDAILRVIREEEPPKPSTRLSALTKEKLGTVAENRGLDPARLHRQLRGDLDWIVMKALEKDRNRRYQTANAFAQDLARFLADEPVAAGPPSVIYRMNKFVRRNRRGLLSGAAAAVALLAGLAVAGGIWLDSTFEKNKRVARALDLIGQAERSLEQNAAADFDDAGHFREARELERRIGESLSGIKHLDDSTRERRERLSRAVATEERARKLVAGIEEVMMRDKTKVETEKPNAQATAQLLAAAFADFGITPLDGQVADTVKLMKTGRETLQDRMLAGLTAWSSALEESNPEQSARLEDIIDRADADPWRRELRQAIKAGDAAVLEALADRKEITEQPTMTVLQLSSALEDKQLAGAVEKLLRRAQREAPASFWTNFMLGETLAGGIDRDEGDDIRDRVIDMGGVKFGNSLPGLIPDKYAVRPEFDESVGFLRAAVVARPDAEMAWLVLGMMLTASGHLDEAIATYQKAASRFPEGSQFLDLLLGQALLGRHRHEEALPHLRRAVERDPADVWTQFNLGKALVETGEYEKARSALLKAAKLASEEARGAEETGGTREQKKPAKVTMAGIEGTISEETAHLFLALAQSGRGDSDEALASTQLALDVNPDSAAAHFFRGMELMKRGQLAAAKTSVQKALELEPKMAAAHNILGAVLMLGGDPNSAVVSFRRALELDPKDASAHCNLGACLGELGESQEALSSLETALDLAPEYALGWSNLGAYFDKQDKPEKAIECFRKAVSFDPNSTTARSGIVRMLWKAGRHDEAIAACRQLNDADTYLRLSASLVKEERIEDAIDALQRAVALKPDSAEAHHDLGNLYLRADRHQDAVKPFRTAIQLAPNMASAYNQLGFVLQFQDDYEAAVAASMKAVVLEPDVEGFKTTLLSALLSSGRITAAELVHGSCDNPQCVITAMLEKDRQLRETLAKEGPGAAGIPALLGDLSDEFFHSGYSSIMGRTPAAADLRAIWDQRREECAKYLASVTVRLIQIRRAGGETHPETNEEDPRAVAEGIVRKLAEGADFAELAEKHSQGWAEGKPETVAYGDLSADLNEAAFSLEKGGFTRKLIEDEHAFYLLKVESRQAGEEEDFEDPKVRKAIENVLTQQRRRDWEQRYLARVQDPAPDLATARARFIAGRVLRLAGEFSRAAEFIQQALAVQSEKLGAGNPETLESMNDLALSYFQAGRLEEALKLQEEVLSLCRKVIGPEHLGTLTAINNLAISYSATGHHDEALKLGEEALPLHRKMLGSEHPDTLKLMTALVGFNSAAGRQEEALKLKEEIEGIRRKKRATQRATAPMAEPEPANSEAGGERRDDALEPLDEVGRQLNPSPSELGETKARAEQGDAPAQNDLGVYYIHGQGVPKDEAKAAEWFRKAADQGHAEAQSNLGACFKKGEGVARDVSEAAKWIRKAAEQGNAEAQCEMGFCYYYGNGVDKNYATALEWYRKAAAQNDAGAQHNLGICYRDGLAVKHDEVEAVKWFRLAAEQNAPLAQNALAFRYLNGLGVALDYKEAVRWYRLAAARNCAEAQYGLACCHAEGLGVERDPVEAYKWMLLAAAQGFAPAKQNMDQIERALTPEQLVEAKKRANDFKPSEQTEP